MVKKSAVHQVYFEVWGKSGKRSTYPGASILTLAHAFVGLNNHTPITTPFLGDTTALKTEVDMTNDVMHNDAVCFLPFLSASSVGVP